MKYFIASRWANMKAVQQLTENLKSFGHEVFSLVSDERNFVSEKALENKPDSETLKSIFDESLEGIRSSDIIILLLPAGKNSHALSGIAYGLDKHLVLIGEIETREPVYQMFDEWHKTIEDYLAQLKSKV